MTGIPDEQILVAVFPGLPTSAELFILPHKNTTEMRKSSEADLEQVRKEGFTDHSFPSYHLQMRPSTFVALEMTCSHCDGTGCIWDCGSIFMSLKRMTFTGKIGFPSTSLRYITVYQQWFFLDRWCVLITAAMAKETLNTYSLHSLEEC